MRTGSAIFGVTTLLIVIAAAALWFGALRIPDRWTPWAPIRLDDAPNLLTKYKLKRLADDRAQCLAVLAQSGMTFTPLADQTLGPQCQFRNVVRITSSKEVTYSSGFVAACPLAVAIALFERHALQPAAEAAFGAPVTAVTHLGTYACRNVDNRDTGRRSQHASANAIDVSAFRLHDGRQITVLRDLSDNPNAGIDARFLQDVHRRACGIFGTILGPDYNALHYNHFHMDMGGFTLCR